MTYFTADNTFGFHANDRTILKAAVQRVLETGRFSDDHVEACYAVTEAWDNDGYNTVESLLESLSEAVV